MGETGMGPGVGFEVLARDGAARRGRLTTAHGTVNTPAFMAVGTAATVKGLTPEEVAASGTEILLGNTYHLMLRPGAERVARLGGLHAQPRCGADESGPAFGASLGADSCLRFASSLLRRLRRCVVVIICFRIRQLRRFIHVTSDISPLGNRQCLADRVIV